MKKFDAVADALADQSAEHEHDQDAEVVDHIGHRPPGEERGSSHGEWR